MRPRIVVIAIVVGALVAVGAIGLAAVVASRFNARNAPSAVQASDVVGQWRSTDGRAGLAIEADGTFTSHDFPFLEQFPGLARIPAEAGTWSLAPAAAYQPYPTLRLRFDGGDGGDHGVPLNIDRRHGPPTVFFWRGDLDSNDRYVFVRQR